MMVLRILIVDDSPLIRTLTRNCLQSIAGWSVCGEAGNGKEAIEKAERMHPDLIVLDLSMPVMNGMQAAQALHKIMPSVPLIMFTSFITQNLEQEALAAGIGRVVGKESTDNLIGAVRSLAVKQAA